MLQVLYISHDLNLLFRLKREGQWRFLMLWSGINNNFLYLSTYNSYEYIQCQSQMFRIWIWVSACLCQHSTMSILVSKDMKMWLLFPVLSYLCSHCPLCSLVSASAMLTVRVNSQLTEQNTDCWLDRTDQSYWLTPSPVVPRPALMDLRHEDWRVDIAGHLLLPLHHLVPPSHRLLPHHPRHQATHSRPGHTLQVRGDGSAPRYNIINIISEHPSCEKQVLSDWCREYDWRRSGGKTHWRSWWL